MVILLISISIAFASSTFKQKKTMHLMHGFNDSDL